MTLRALRLWGLVLLLALPSQALAASAARRSRVPAGPHSVHPIHPLILGSPADTRSPIVKSLRAQSSSFEKLRSEGLAPTAAALHLAALAAARKEPLEMAATGVLARILAEPDAGRRLLSDNESLSGTALAAAAPSEAATREEAAALHQLAHSALGEALSRHVFDGDGASSLELDGIDWRREKVPELGRGEFGVVLEHPRIRGAVIKIVQLSAEALIFAGATPPKVASDEEASARALAAASAGPRYFGRAQVGRLHMSVRERVYGETLESLVWQRRFGAEERDLVLGLLRRMAEARIGADDMRPPNIMFGRTLADPERKAYLVDGGAILPLDRSEDVSALADSLYRHEVRLQVRWDPNVGEIIRTKPLSRIIEEGMARSAEKTFWERFKGGLWRMWDGYTLPPPP